MSVVENVVESLKARVLLPSGPYIAEVAKQPRPRKAVSRGRLGVSLTFKILEGEFAGRLAPVDLFIEAQQNDRRVHHDVVALTAWLDLLGVGKAPSLIRLIEQLRQAAEGKRLEFTLQRQTWGGGLELQLTTVRLVP
jgi:hypothetical protein